MRHVVGRTRRSRRRLPPPRHAACPRRQRARRRVQITFIAIDATFTRVCHYAASLTPPRGSTRGRRLRQHAPSATSRHALPRMPHVMLYVTIYAAHYDIVIIIAASHFTQRNMFIAPCHV